MEITSLGHASFKIRGKQATLVTDPYDPSLVGLKFPRNIEADIVTVSHDHPDHNYVTAVSGQPFVIRGPGEYEVKGVAMVGIATFHDEAGGGKRGRNTLYRIDIDGVSLVHLGDLGHKLTSEQLDALDGVDILLTPVGGFYTIDAGVAAQIVGDLEPKIVIPMHYNRAGLNQDGFGELQPVSAFLKEIGKEGVAPQPKLTISKDKLPTELQVIVLE